MNQTGHHTLNLMHVCHYPMIFIIQFTSDLSKSVVNTDPPVSEYEGFMLRNFANPFTCSRRGLNTLAFLILFFHSRCLYQFLKLTWRIKSTTLSLQNNLGLWKIFKIKIKFCSSNDSLRPLNAYDSSPRHWIASFLPISNKAFLVELRTGNEKKHICFAYIVK